MWINSLTIENCRSLSRVQLDLSQNLNILIGENASGKTSLLEALTLLSSGRSFRTSHISSVISYNAESVLVSASLTDSNDLKSYIGIEKNKQKTTIRINKKNIFSQAELSSHLPITIIHPGSIELITGSPSARRSFIDWIAFYKFNDFHDKWKTYQHILKQRNLCLKDTKHRSSLEKWTAELVALQPVLHSYRSDALRLLRKEWSIISKILLPNIKFDLIYKSGLPDNVQLTSYALMDYYKQRESYDFKLQRTTGGVHRADFKVMMENTFAVETASRGQLKLLAISLLLARSTVLSTENTAKGILLIDDLAAELDIKNKDTLLEYLSSLRQQLIITMTKQYDIPNLNKKVFHVKHGEVSLLK